MSVDVVVQLLGALVAVIGGWIGVRKWQQERAKQEDERRDSLAAIVDRRVAMLIDEYQEQLKEARQAGRECAEKIERLSQEVEEHRLVINGWIAGYEILRQQLDELGHTPNWAPAGPLLPRPGSQGE